MAMFARIHPVNKATGHKVKRYTFRGFRFEVDKGWYKVPNDVAEQLKVCYQDKYAELQISVFQVATEEEAKGLQRSDYEKENPNRKIEEAVSGAQSVPSKRLQPLGEPDELDEEDDLDEEDGPSEDSIEVSEANPFE